MAGITIQNLTKHFSDGSESVVAVDGLDLTVNDGEFVVLVGPSGCGKTTTLRCIAGLESVTEGEIKLGEEVVTDKAPEKRDIAMVFQSYALYPHMTVRENMGFGLKYASDLNDHEIESRITEAAEMMEIGDLLDRHPEDLSGGQQQRVALGRAIVRQPEAFLMDEPLSNLDAKLRAEMRTYLQQLQEDIGVTTVYVTHDQTEAMTMGDKIAILSDGRLQQYGTPAECYHKPQNTFVAEFIGEPSINLFNMDVRDGRLVNQFFEFQPESDVSPTGDEVVMGVRPETLRISDDEPTDPSTFRTEIIAVEHLGKETNVHVSIPESETNLTVIVEGHPSITVGDMVTVEIPSNAVHIFDAQNGDVIHSATYDESRPTFGQVM